jgi:hypothetical protein
MSNLDRLSASLGRTVVALTLALLLLSARSAQAAFIELAWDPNPEADIAGYMVFYGPTAGSYEASVDVGNTTTWTGNQLTAGRPYVFAVLAYTTQGEQSALSAELTATPFAPATVLTPLPGTALASTAVPFAWTPGSHVSQYRLSVGTAAGSGNLFDQTATTTTLTVPSIPATATVFVRLWSLIGATWHFTDYTYTAARPTLTIADVTVPEGHSGAHAASFTVRLTPPAATPVTVTYTTANGTAAAGDYASKQRTLTFAPGESLATVAIAINGDTTVEPDETFFVRLSNASAPAVIGTAQATGTIQNDDGEAAGTPTAAPLSDRRWTAMTNGWGPVEADRSNGEDGAADGQTLTLNGVPYAKGLGVHAPADVRYALNGRCSTLTAVVGVDDEVGDHGSMAFQVWADGVKKYDSGVLTGAMAPVALSVNLTGATELALIVTDGGDNINYDHGDWAQAQLTCTAF